MSRVVEICLTDIESAWAARVGGADRVELCVDLASGGLTPSLGLISALVDRVGIETHVLIRPRAGDFRYSDGEIEVMVAEIRAVRTVGAAGVVVGGLSADGSVDVGAITRMVAAARPLAIAFHRAIDLLDDPVTAVATLVALGVDRILTAGGPGPARGNVAALRALVREAAGRIEITIGGSVEASDLPGLLDATGAGSVHLHSGVIGPAFAPGRFGARPALVEAGRVRRIVDLVK